MNAVPEDVLDRRRTGRKDSGQARSTLSRPDWRVGDEEDTGDARLLGEHREGELLALSSEQTFSFCASLMGLLRGVRRVSPVFTDDWVVSSDWLWSRCLSSAIVEWRGGARSECSRVVVLRR